LLIRSSSNTSNFLLLEFHGQLHLLFLVSYNSLVGDNGFLRCFWDSLCRCLPVELELVWASFSSTFGPGAPNTAHTGFFYLVLCYLQHLTLVGFIIK
jgi:hypothetical protein